MSTTTPKTSSILHESVDTLINANKKGLNRAGGQLDSTHALSTALLCVSSGNAYRRRRTKRPVMLSPSSVNVAGSGMARTVVNPGFV